jgi:DNA-binding LacI/PurR family transcriptional regulator
MGINFNDPTPLYEQIENDIKFKITEGDLRVGDQVGSQHQLAKDYDVSLITIKKALSNLIAKGILFSRVGKGTYVARRSSSLAISGHKTIGLVLRDLKHPFFSLIVQAVEEKAYNMGYNILLSTSSGKIEKEESQINHFQEIGVDGLIIASMTLEYRATNKIRMLHESQFPYVMVSYMHDPDIWHVGTDNAKGMFMAAHHLIELGYNKIGFINSEEGNLLGTVRREGFVNCMRQHNKKIDEHFIIQLGKGKDRFKEGYEFGKNFKKIKHKPEALIFYNDITALGFQQGAIEIGMRIPDDIAVVGFDDIDRSKFAPSPLTTIRQPTDRIGEIAVETVIKRIEGKNARIRTTLEPELIVRSSCGIDIKRKKSSSKQKELAI